MAHGAFSNYLFLSSFNPVIRESYGEQRPFTSSSEVGVVIPPDGVIAAVQELGQITLENIEGAVIRIYQDCGILKSVFDQLVSWAKDDKFFADADITGKWCNHIIYNLVPLGHAIHIRSRKQPDHPWHLKMINTIDSKSFFCFQVIF